MPSDRNDEYEDATTGKVRRDETIDFGDEFGVVKFADGDDTGPAITISDGDTERLPHWSDAPTGEVPRSLQGDAPPGDVSRPTQRPRVDLTGGARRQPVVTTPPPVSRQAPTGRIVIGSDPTGETERRSREARTAARERTDGQSRPTSRGDIARDVSRELQRDAARDVPRGGQRPAPVRRTRPSRADSGNRPRPARRGSSRDMNAAVLVGGVLAVLFIAAILVGPPVVVALIVVVLAIAALEFFTHVSSRSLTPPMAIAVVACVAAPLAAYWVAHLALPLVITFTLIAGSITLLGARDGDANPIANLGVLLLGVVYVGVLGSYGALIARMSTLTPALPNIGTDTLFLAVIAVAVNDIAAYFVGSAIGRTPLSARISPNKTVEGLIGGTIGTFVAVVLIGLNSSTWNGIGEQILFALVVAVMAPLGDLTESMIKRNLDVKDFGTLLKGHGGVLDRFDGLLFVLPSVYYLTVVLAPWSS
jgi:phosphatidate cytidylyltransferase